MKKRKLKTKSGAKKRVKITGSGKIKIGKSNRRHLLTAKSQKTKRQSRQGAYVSAADEKNIRALIAG
ncbi:MAG: 50S ribosomal protein L35 [Deltaproteobacteria bacterium]|nr:50S ribosomal protein L35 [Deltaproteobacteria bacterium]